MAESTLRSQVLRLAAENEELRPVMLGLLTRAGERLTPKEALLLSLPTAEVQEEKPPASVSSMFVPQRAEKGFNEELLPELTALQEKGLSRLEAARLVYGALETAFQKKDMLYNILIVYQSSFEGDSVFLSHLKKLVETWVLADVGV